MVGDTGQYLVKTHDLSEGCCQAFPLTPREKAHYMLYLLYLFDRCFMLYLQLFHVKAANIMAAEPGYNPKTID